MHNGLRPQGAGNPPLRYLSSHAKGPDSPPPVLSPRLEASSLVGRTDPTSAQTRSRHRPDLGTDPDLSRKGSSPEIAQSLVASLALDSGLCTGACRSALRGSGRCRSGWRWQYRAAMPGMPPKREPPRPTLPGHPGQEAPRAPGAAVFVDLDRTLLAGASGLVLSTAMRAEGLFDGRMRLPGEGLFYGVYEAIGESLPFMAMVRAAVRFVRGWPVEAVRRAGEVAAPQLLELLQPYAPGVLAEHRRAGRQLVLATTSPVDLVAPFARLLGLDDVVATCYEHEAGRYTGRIEGPFVWGIGKLAAVRSWAAARHVDLGASHAYSDSIFDVPLLASVGHAHAVHPDIRLRLAAALSRWPVEHWDRPVGVPKVVGLEPYHLLRLGVRQASFPYARFDIEGLDQIPARGPVLVVANHRSYFDVAALALVAAGMGRPVRFLAKQELFDAPVVGWLARALGGIAVDRGADPGRSLHDARRALEAGEPVVIMPQGTIPRGAAFYDPVLRGRTGAARLAAQTGAPIVPVGIWGTEAVWPRSARLPNLTNLTHPPTVRVRVGPPIDLAEAAVDDPVAATEQIMTAIVSLLPASATRVITPTLAQVAAAMPPGAAVPSAESVPLGAAAPSADAASVAEVLPRRNSH